MKPPRFRYLRPASVEEALAQLAQPGAKVIAGGQSLGPMINMRLAQPGQLVDLNDLSELAYLRENGDWIEVGALTRHDQVATSPLVHRHCPLLADAAQTIGHYAIRQRGTLGGSLAHADPAAQLPLVAVTLGARLNLVRGGSHRQLPAREFFKGAMTTALQPDEMIASVLFPKAHPHEGAAFRMFNRRRGDYAIVAAAAAVRVDAGRVASVRLGLSGAAPVPLALDHLAQPWLGQEAAGDWTRQLAAAVRGAVTPEDDGRMPVLYRQELAEYMTIAALRRAAEAA